MSDLKEVLKKLGGLPKREILVRTLYIFISDQLHTKPNRFLCTASQKIILFEAVIYLFSCFERLQLLKHSTTPSLFNA